MEDEDQDSTGTLGAITNQLGELLDPTTTPEAQGYARQFLDKQLNSSLGTSQKEILTQMEKESREAQEVLRAARAKLLARRYNPADRWYSLSKALGAPTRVGGVGELASRTAGALNESGQRERAYEEAQDKDALGYDEKIAEMKQRLLGLKSSVGLSQGKIDADLAKEALKTLGKRVNSQQTGVDKAQQALDRAYAPEYLDWVQNGQSVANKSLTELSQVHDRLRGYKLGPSGEKVPIKEGDFVTRQLGPTGRVIGSVATVPFVGKALQDVLAPGSADIREMVESTVQSSLRPILGPQFTEKEGERLISRVYNPRMSTEVNAARVNRLFQQIKNASAAKTAAAKYYERNGTLKGFTGRYKFTIDDFMPAPVNPLAPGPQGGEVDDHGVPYDGPPNPYAGTPDENNAPAGGGPAPVGAESTDAPRTWNGKPVIKFEQFPRRGYAEGGAVAGPQDTDTVMAELPDGRLIPVPADATQEDIAALVGGDTGGSYDSGASRASLAALGAGLGYGSGRLLSSLGSTAADLRPGNKETKAQSRLLRVMERSNLPPDQITAFQRRFGRLGVPTMPLDFDPNLRATAETAMTHGGADAVDMMDRLKERQAGARARTLEQVNKGLKPDDYFDKEREIKEKLYGDRTKNIESESAPLYRAAESQYPAVTSAQLGKLMDTPTGKKAVKNAMQTMKDRNKPIGKVNPVTGAVMKPSLEFLNQVKIEMDNLVGAAKTKGKDAKARDIGNLRTSFRNELDTATTDPATGASPYKNARETYESRKAHLDALQEGREKFSRMQPQEVAQRVAQMNFEQKDAFRTGVSQSISQMLNTPSTDINAAKRLVGSPAMQAKLQALFDTPHEFAVFKAALDKEVETFENSQKILSSESTVRKRGAEPPKGRIARGAEAAPSLGLLSPTHWALKILRRKPEIDPKEASEVIKLLKSSTPEEIANFEKSLRGKFGRKAARSKRGSRMGMAGAAIGALTGALMGGEDDDNPPLDEGVLAGLDEEGRQAALKPAYAEGGKVGVIKELIEALRTKYKQMQPDAETLKHDITNVAIKTGEMPATVWKALTGREGALPWETAPDLSRQAPVAPITQVPAQPEALAPFARSMDYEKSRLKAIKDSLDLRRDLTPDRREALAPSVYSADNAFDRMMAQPSPENMQRLTELVRSLSDMAERRKTPRAVPGQNAFVPGLGLVDSDQANEAQKLQRAYPPGSPTLWPPEELERWHRERGLPYEQARGGRIRRHIGGGTNHA